MRFTPVYLSKPYILIYPRLGMTKQLTQQEIEKLTQSKGLTRSEFLTRMGNCKSAYEEIKKCLDISLESNNDRHEIAYWKREKKYYEKLIIAYFLNDELDSNGDQVNALDQQGVDY